MRTIALASLASLLLFVDVSPAAFRFGPAQAAANKVTDAFKKAGDKIKQGVQKAGEKIKEGVQKGLDIAKKVKDKIVNALKGFASKALEAVKPLVSALLSDTVAKILGKLGFTLEDAQRCVDPKTGKINDAEVKSVIIARLGDFLRP